MAKYNGRNNAISKLAYQMAGGVRRFYHLSYARRLELRAAASTLYDADVEFTLAAQKIKQTTRGSVYVLWHPAFDRYYGRPVVKIGKANVVQARLSSFNTGCPFNAYEMHFAQYFEDAYAAEAALHARLKPLQLEGEWFAMDRWQAQEAIEAYARLNNHQLETDYVG